MYFKSTLQILDKMFAIFRDYDIYVSINKSRWEKLHKITVPEIQKVASSKLHLGVWNSYPGIDFII